MKVLFVGLGSIGLRHLKNLSAVCEMKEIELEVVALRATTRPLDEDVEKLIDRQVQALPKDEYFDMAFITNPTSLHAITIGELQGCVNAFFIEKPIFDHAGYNLGLLGLGRNQKAYVAAPMRWTALYMALKKAIKDIPVYSARAICSSYLPAWRAGVDYRNVYSAHREMGGGVSLDLIHEWDYLCDLFGLPEECFNMRGTYSDLEIDSDDLSIYIAKWPGMLAEVHLDYFGRESRRNLELFCAEGTWKADYITGMLTYPDGTTEDYSEELNCRYIREMEYFVNYTLAGTGQSVNSPVLALLVLRTALGENHKKGDVPCQEC